MYALAFSTGALLVGAVAVGLVDPMIATSGSRLAAVARQVADPGAEPDTAHAQRVAERIAAAKLGRGPAASSGSPEVMVPGNYKELGICPPEGATPDDKVCVVLDWQPLGTPAP